jgi:hypothetical protein
MIKVDFVAKIYDSIEVTPAEFALVQALCFDGMFYIATSFIQEQYGVKRACAEAICQQIFSHKKTHGWSIRNIAEEMKKNHQQTVPDTMPLGALLREKLYKEPRE